MRMYVVGMVTGVLVGIIYALFEVSSPAPPVIGLAGLLGYLLGEVVLLAARLLAGEPTGISPFKNDCAPHVFGELPAERNIAFVPDRVVRT
jgi:XapX domain-containing protein